MRIEDRIKIFQIYTQTAKVSRVEKKQEVASTDKIEISSEAREFQAVLNAIKQTPDVREDKVNEIKKKIDSGTYNVSGKDVVEKLIREYKASKKNE
ncbi:Anti-sigma-28 factor FlgM family protein [Caldicellulosiruptor kronotskyensis 2002]|uniref:Negative regulator of flagellin synthesis n=1 Tax=Caldicellulosiruptor kronotskyensis (strain DSM 18902 / VKM B-2412 / 2002) TaxID=632348 RepID=E4SBC6_CALK2|nr:flagellar biosynthesis anti-sigma factor FlgM [Caldicellulosiruptor kronotskyensis]ADQ45908.1 Anti-sigma-28 factor FlgM family protein [Caldicellulosiruptor kronotskyensis 2002]